MGTVDWNAYMRAYRAKHPELHEKYNDYMREYMREYRKRKPEMAEQHRRYGQERYRWLKSHGICTYCAAADAEDGFVECAACRKKKREMMEKKRQKERERQ